MATTVRSVMVRLGVSERGFSRGFRAATRDVQKFQRSTDTNLSKVRASVLKVSTGLKGLTKGFTVSVKTAAAVGALSALAGAAAVSAQQVLVLGAALAPLGGLLAAVPGAIGLVAAGMVTLKIATSGMSDAFGAALDLNWEKFDKALAKMGPAARKLALEFKALVPALHTIRNAAQAGVFGPLHGELTKTVKILNIPLRSAFRALGAEIGLAGREVLRFARATESVKGLQSVFFSASKALSFLRPAIQPLLGGFRDLAVVGARWLTSLTPAIGAAAAAFGKFLSASARSGKATEWMNNALAVLQQLFRILGNVGSILGSLFKAANASGGGLLGTIEKLTGQFAAFLKSTEGAKTLRAIFSGIGEIGKALGPVIIALGKGLGAVAPSIGRIATLVGPILTKAINALAPALTKLEPGITALIVGLGGAFEAIAPALPAVAQALSDIAIALAPVLPALGYLVAQLAGGLAVAISQLVASGALPQLVTAVIQFGLALGGGLTDALIAITPYLPELVMSLSELLITLTPLIPEMTKAAIALAPMIPVLTDMITQVTQLTRDVLPGFIFFIQSTVMVTEDLVTVVKNSWFLISNAIKFYIDKVNKVIDGLGKLAGKFGGWFKGAKDSAVKKLGELVDWCKGLGTRIKNGLGDLGKLLYRAGQNVINGLIDGIVSKFNSLRNILGTVTRAIPDWKGPMDTDKRLLTPAGTAIMGGLISGIVGQLPALRAVLGTVTTTIGAPGQPGLAVAGPGLPQPRGALRTADRQQQSGIDYQRLAAALVSALKAEGVGAVHLDGKVLTDTVSRRTGQATQLRRRTG